MNVYDPLHACKQQRRLCQVCSTAAVHHCSTTLLSEHRQNEEVRPHHMSFPCTLWVQYGQPPLTSETHDAWGINLHTGAVRCTPSQSGILAAGCFG